MGVCRASSTLLTYTEVPKHCFDCPDCRVSLFPVFSILVTRDELTEEDIAQIRGLDIVERKACTDSNNTPIGKSQLNDHLKHNPGHIFVSHLR